MVWNEVRDIPELNYVVYQEAQFKTRYTNTNITFKNYLDLLKSASDKYDVKYNYRQSFWNNPK